MATTPMASFIDLSGATAQAAQAAGLEMGAAPLTFIQQYQTQLLIAGGVFIAFKLLF